MISAPWSPSLSFFPSHVQAQVHCYSFPLCFHILIKANFFFFSSNFSLSFSLPQQLICISSLESLEFSFQELYFSAAAASICLAWMSSKWERERASAKAENFLLRLLLLLLLDDHFVKNFFETETERIYLLDFTFQALERVVFKDCLISQSKSRQQQHFIIDSAIRQRRGGGEGRNWISVFLLPHFHDSADQLNLNKTASVCLSAWPCYYNPLFHIWKKVVAWLKLRWAFLLCIDGAKTRAKPSKA